MKTDSNGLRSPVVEVVPRIVHGVKTADDKLVALVRERPIAALCAAVAVGYLIGRVFSRYG